jgi:hypothetical protein
MNTPHTPDPGVQPDPQPPPKPAAPEVTATPKKKMKLWKKILLVAGCVILGLLLVILVAGPTVISSVAKSKIPSVLGEMLMADAKVGDVSFSWNGHVTIDDFKMTPRGFTNALVEVKKIDVKVDVMAALGGKYIAQVEVVAPKVVVEKGADGKFNYEFELPKSEEPGKDKGKGKESSGKMPHVEAVLKVRDGEVTIHGRNRTTQYQKLEVSAKVDTLEKPIEYSLSLESPEKDALKVNGAYDFEKQTGPATVKLEHFSLKNLTGAVRAYSDLLELGGTVDGTLEYQLHGGPHLSGKGRLEIADFILVMHDPVLKRDQTMKLDRLSFGHDVTLDDKRVSTHTLTLKSGKAIDATIVAVVADPLGERRVRTDIRFDSDLPELVKTLRNLEALPPDMELAGRISLKGKTETSGPTDADLKAGKMAIPAKLDLELAGQGLVITLKKGEAPMKLDGFSFRHAGNLDEKGNGKHTLTLTSGKAVTSTVSVDVKDAFGTPEVKTDLKLDSDLAELDKVLQGLVGLQQDMKLEGSIALKGTIATKGPNLEDVKAKKKPVVSATADFGLAATNLVAIDATNKRIDIDKSITLTLKGRWDGKSANGDLETFKLDSSFATADAKGGATLKGEDVEIRQSSVRFDADLAKLNAKLESFMKDPPRLAGTVAVNATYDGAKVGIDAAIKGFKAGLKERTIGPDKKEVVKETTYGPLDLSIKDDGKMDKEANGTHSIRVDSGKALAMGITLELKDTLKETRAVKADVTLDSDLGALAAILPPGMVQLKEDTDLAGAAKVTVKVTTKSTPKPAPKNAAKDATPPAPDMSISFDVNAALTGLEAVEKKTKKRSEIDKSVTLKALGVFDSGKKDVDLKDFELRSSFANADAKGGFVLTDPMTVRQSSLEAKADLAALGAKLGLFMAEPPALVGSVEATASYAGDRYSSDVTVKGVKVVTKQTVKENGKDVVKTSTIGPVDLSMVQKGTLSLAADGGLKIETCTIASSALNATVSGEVRKVQQDNREGQVKLGVSVKPVELSKWMPDLGMGGPEIKLATSVSLKPHLITVTGSTQLDGLTMTSKDAVTGKPVTKTAKSAPLDFSVEMKDKDILAKAKTALFDWVDAGYAAKCGLDASVTYNADKGTTGTTKLANLEITDDKKNVVKDPGLTIVHDIGMETKETGKTKSQVITLRKTDVSSTFLAGSVTGKVTIDDRGQAFEKLKVDFKYFPDKLGAVLAPWLPGKLEGAQEKLLKVTVDGRADSGDVLALLRGLQAGVDLDLAKFSMPDSGLTVSGKTQLALRDGRLTTGTPLELNKGKTDLQCTADFRDEKKNPASTINFNAKDVQANGKMKILQAINPIFHVDEKGESTVDGQINADFKLAWTGKLDPAWEKAGWEGAAVGSLKGTGVFGMKNLKIVGSPTVTELMTLLGEGNSIQGELVASDIDLGNKKVGWCRYDNMVLRLSKYDVKFRGGVAFASNTRGSEREMDLEVEIPMTDSMVKSQPGLAKYLGQRFWIPLKGTVEHPMLDYKKLFLDLAKNAAETLIKDKAADAIKNLLDKKKKDK